ncbi:hypothetical protein SAMN05660420_01390 [Desulfuromusa kysingii]|uniref:PH domain-containing protein n=1 Tax=Desulfuromusa kysingii TaxID=37625 RepID=A0A1H3YUC6_9BACT|nr:hypothetical protein [Desulfuromusa kysingii]SEA15010.1 hypothetical protein SAMN05660420_01390 [Desulfuromusa kysingii]
MIQGSFNWSLQDGETILWQGRPAPRCYTFRHWLQATIGTILYLASCFWLMVGVELVRSQGYSWWLAIAPFLIALAAFAVGPGQLIMARLRWEKVFYALTDQRLLVRNRMFKTTTNSYPLCHFKKVKQKHYGEHLSSLRLSFQETQPVTLECIEHPENFLNLLPQGDS